MESQPVDVDDSDDSDLVVLKTVYSKEMKLLHDVNIKATDSCVIARWILFLKFTVKLHVVQPTFTPSM